MHVRIDTKSAHKDVDLFDDGIRHKLTWCEGVVNDPHCKVTGEGIEHLFYRLTTGRAVI